MVSKSFIFKMCFYFYMKLNFFYKNKEPQGNLP